MYHISDCRKYIRCPHLFVYKEEAESSTYIPFVLLDESMTELVKKRLGITDCFEGKRGDEASLALQALSNSEWLVNARFEHDRLRVKMPFMHKNEEGWDLYFLFLRGPVEHEAAAYGLHVFRSEPCGCCVRGFLG